jgi:hypothetical protein
MNLAEGHPMALQQPIWVSFFHELKGGGGGCPVLVLGISKLLCYVEDE